MNDIKAIVADLEKLDRVATPAPWGQRNRCVAVIAAL
mgnify:CR=1 FL=1